MAKSARRTSRSAPATPASSAASTSRDRRRARHERGPAASPPSALERHRRSIVVALVVVAIAAVGLFVYASATSPAYACSTIWQPPASPTASGLGAPQDDMGRLHIQAGQFVRYPSCPPASGEHINQAGQGPIPARVYGPNDAAIPQGWIHNLEHGGMVVLYKCDGTDACTDTGQQRFKDFYSSFPPSPVCGVPAGQIAPVIARFDQMGAPYAALVWDRVLYLDSFDTTKILAFYQTEAERANPEPQCPSPSPAGSPAASPAPSPSPS